MLKYLKRISFLINRIFFPSNMKITGKCRQCGECCRNIIIINEGKIIKDLTVFEQIKDSDPFYQNLIFHKICESGFLRFTCLYLLNNRCSAYQSRPVICKHYPSVRMFKYGGALTENCGFAIEARKSFSYFLDNQR